jgi:hypothetical protein
MIRRHYPKNEAKEELPRIEPLTSSFPLSNLNPISQRMKQKKNFRESNL